MQFFFRMISQKQQYSSVSQLYKQQQHQGLLLGDSGQGTIIRVNKPDRSHIVDPTDNSVYDLDQLINNYNWNYQNNRPGNPNFDKLTPDDQAKARQYTQQLRDQIDYVGKVYSDQMAAWQEQLRWDLEDQTNDTRSQNDKDFMTQQNDELYRKLRIQNILGWILLAAVNFGIAKWIMLSRK